MAAMTVVISWNELMLVMRVKEGVRRADQGRKEAEGNGLK